VDAQGGEKLALMARLYGILVNDAVERGLMQDDFYFLGDKILGSFKRMQGYAEVAEFSGPHIEQAYLILAQPELQVQRAIAKADGFPLNDRPLLGGMIVVFDS